MRNWKGKHVDTNEVKKWTPDRKKITVVYQVQCKDCHQHRTLPHPRRTTSSTVLTRRQLVVRMCSCMHFTTYCIGLVWYLAAVDAVHVLTNPGCTADTTTPLPATLLCRAAPIKTYIMDSNKYLLSHITSKHCNCIFNIQYSILFKCTMCHAH